MLRKAIAARAPIKVALATKSEALRLRGRIYAFRRALVNAEGLVSGFEDLMLLAPLARMRIDGPNLIIEIEGVKHEPATAGSLPAPVPGQS